MFPINIANDEAYDHACFFFVNMKDNAWLWHLRYKHLNFNRLKMLQQKGIVRRIPQITHPSQVCEDCVIDKQQRDSFPKGRALRA